VAMLKVGVSDPLKELNSVNEFTKVSPTDGEGLCGIF